MYNPLCEYISSVPERLNSVTVINDMISHLQMTSLCIGNPDEKFTLIKDTHKGVFKSKNGENIKLLYCH